jgi:undecaprenyl phosphate-alpha-L-ara4FN deformylase
MKIGLRIDVDTLRGTRLGVPSLLRMLADHQIKGTFYFSVGPDNMGRHLWRLLRPTFLWKMLRTKAASLYGWDILFKGTFWPGPIIGKKCADIIRSAAEAGHEVGLHAWDHHAWQAHIDTMDAEAIHRSLSRGVDMLGQILGRSPTCSAVPGWKCNDLVLKAKSTFPFEHNSDCRGESIFRPIVDGVGATHASPVLQPQVPVTLPTYDEVIGRNGITNDNYNDHMLSLLDPNKLNVLTIHAEVEGIICRQIFAEFVQRAQSSGHTFVPLGALVRECRPIPSGKIIAEEIPGREGWVACQRSEVVSHR